MAAATPLRHRRLGYRAWDVEVCRSTGRCRCRGTMAGSDRDGNRRPLRGAILAASPHTHSHGCSRYPRPRLPCTRIGATLGTFIRSAAKCISGWAARSRSSSARRARSGSPPMSHPSDGRLSSRPGRAPSSPRGSRSLAGQSSLDRYSMRFLRRHTNRGPYLDEPSARAIAATGDLVSSPTVRVAFRRGRGRVARIRRADRPGNREIVADPEMSMDSLRWIRTGRRDVLAHRDGVTIDTVNPSRPMTVAAVAARSRREGNRSDLGRDDAGCSHRDGVGVWDDPGARPPGHAAGDRGRARLAAAASGRDAAGHRGAAAEPAGRDDRSPSRCSERRTSSGRRLTRLAPAAAGNRRSSSDWDTRRASAAVPRRPLSDVVTAASPDH